VTRAEGSVRVCPRGIAGFAVAGFAACSLGTVIGFFFGLLRGSGFPSGLSCDGHRCLVWVIVRERVFLERSSCYSCFGSAGCLRGSLVFGSFFSVSLWLG
jgi:hypothetical protein